MPGETTPAQVRPPAARDAGHPSPRVPTAFELAQLAVALAPCLKRPADECLEAAEALYEKAQWLISTRGDPDGPLEVYQHGQEIVLEGEKSLNDLDAFPEVEADVLFLCENEEEPRNDIVPVRGTRTWRGLKKTIKRLVADGFLQEYAAAVMDVERLRVSRASVRDINDARVRAQAVATVKRKRGIGGSATYPDYETKEPRRIGLNASKIPNGTGPGKPGTQEATVQVPAQNGPKKKRNRRRVSRKSAPL